MSTTDIFLNGILLVVFELFSFWGHDLVSRKYSLGWLAVAFRSVGQLYVVAVIGYHAMIIPLTVVALIQIRSFWDWWSDFKDPSPF